MQFIAAFSFATEANAVKLVPSFLPDRATASAFARLHHRNQGNTLKIYARLPVANLLVHTAVLRASAAGASRTSSAEGASGVYEQIRYRQARVYF